VSGSVAGVDGKRAVRNGAKVKPKDAWNPMPR
jgi:hypothetical protein